MKNYFFLLLLIKLLTFRCLYSQSVCNTDEYVENCTNLLNHVFDDYEYLKSNVSYFKGQKIIYSNVKLEKGNLYVFNVCEAEAKSNMAIDLYNKKDSLLATSIDTLANINNKILVYMPTKTGVYEIATHFQEKNKSCCIVMMGIIRKNINHYIRVSQ